MELSKKVGYIKGLMAGLNISDSTPEGMVLHAMSDLLEEMADEIETNAELIDEIGMYIDDLEDLDDIFEDDDLDDIPVEVFDRDPDELREADSLEDLSGLDELEQTELPPESAGEEQFECQCPKCGAIIPLTVGDIERGSIVCGICGTELSLE